MFGCDFIAFGEGGCAGEGNTEEVSEGVDSEASERRFEILGEGIEGLGGPEVCTYLEFGSGVAGSAVGGDAKEITLGIDGEASGVNAGSAIKIEDGVD